MGIKRHRCKDCEFGSPTLVKLENHINEVHLKIKPYKCGICEKSFSRAEHVKIHNEGVHSEKVNCGHCKKELKNKITLKAHMKRLHPNTNKLYQCDMCENTYTTISALTVHKKAVHEKKYHVKCDFCDLEVCNRTALKSHIKVQHKGEIQKRSMDRKVNCNLCGKRMFSLCSLNKHLTQVHKVKAYKCFQCKDLFAGLDDLKLHLQIAHAINEPDKLSINLESQSYSSGPSFECSICMERFGTNAQLKMHFDSVHEEVKLNCDICGKVLPYLSSLRSHMRFAHHQGKGAHVCNICGKDFKLKRYCDEHIRMDHNLNI